MQTRSNGIIVYIILSIFLIFLYHKKFNKIIFLFLLTPLLLNYTLNFTIDHKYKIEHYFQESMAIPIQQLSATVYKNGKLNSSEKKFINTLLPINTIKSSYTPGNVDSIKWHKDFNHNYLQKNKGKFLKTWINILPKNFTTYVESYLLQTYNFWNIRIISTNANMYYDTHTNDAGDYVNLIKSRYNIYVNDLFPQNIQEKLENFYFKNVKFIGEGLCFWLLCFLAIVTIYKKQEKYLLILVPYLSIWFSLIVATPVNSSLRYIFPFVLNIPLLFAIILSLKNKELR